MTVFNPLSDAYDAYRPSYPPALYAWLADRLALNRDSRLLDVACGTGKSTLPLCPLSEHVTGLELSAPMLVHARRRAAESGCEVTWINARAEATGLFSASQDLVTVAQAFHWLKAEATDELARVLKPGGGLAIYWNVPDTSQPYYQALLRLIEIFNPDYQPPYERFFETAQRLEAHGAFDHVEHVQFEHVVPYTVDQYIGYQASRSFVGGALTGDAWGRFAERLGRTLLGHFPDGVVEERYHVPLYLGIKGTP